jgi:uncharacterized protein with PQ loop repeat
MILTIGYLASALLAISLVVNNAIKFRWLNLGGCAAFVIYGVLIDAFPVILANAILLGINIIQTIKLYTVNEAFEMVSVNESDEIVAKFLSFYKQDIKRYFPDDSFHNEPNQKQISFVVLRDLSIANIFVASISSNGEAVVKINYTVPKYRDYKVGRFIFEKENEFLLQHGIKSIVYEKVFNKSHLLFIEKMGFNIKKINNQSFYIKDVVKN